MTTPEDRQRYRFWLTPIPGLTTGRPVGMSLRLALEDITTPWERGECGAWFAHIPGLMVRRVKGFGMREGATFLAPGICLTFGAVWEEPSRVPGQLPALWKFWPSYQGLKHHGSIAWYRTHRRVHHPCKDFKRWKGCAAIPWRPMLPGPFLMLKER